VLIEFEDDRFMLYKTVSNGIEFEV